MVRVQIDAVTVEEFTDPTQTDAVYNEAVNKGYTAWEYDSDGNCIRNTINVPSSYVIAPTLTPTAFTPITCPHCGQVIEVKS